MVVYEIGNYKIIDIGKKEKPYYLTKNDEVVIDIGFKILNTAKMVADYHYKKTFKKG